MILLVSSRIFFLKMVNLLFAFALQVTLCFYLQDDKNSPALPLMMAANGHRPCHLLIPLAPLLQKRYVLF